MISYLCVQSSRPMYLLVAILHVLRLMLLVHYGCIASIIDIPYGCNDVRQKGMDKNIYQNFKQQI